MDPTDNRFVLTSMNPNNIFYGLFLDNPFLIGVFNSPLGNSPVEPFMGINSNNQLILTTSNQTYFYLPNYSLTSTTPNPCYNNKPVSCGTNQLGFGNYTTPYIIVLVTWIIHVCTPNSNIGFYISNPPIVINMSPVSYPIDLVNAPSEANSYPNHI